MCLNIYQLFNSLQIRTIKVDNISINASEWDITEFFSFSGDIQYVEMQRSANLYHKVIY